MLKLFFIILNICNALGIRCISYYKGPVGPLGTTGRAGSSGNLVSITIINGIYGN
jgi:hypothetical protein